MNKLCEVGVITKPQGLKGHFRVRLNYSNFSMLSELKEVVIENYKYEIEKITHRDGFEIFKVKGIDNIDVVENLRNKIIYAEISERKTLAKDEFYIRDLIGSNMFVDKDKRKCNWVNSVRSRKSGWFLTNNNDIKNVVITVECLN